MKNNFLFVALLFVLCGLHSQESSSTRFNYRYHILPSSQEIKIDGVEQPGEWQSHTLIDTLYNHNPSDVGLAKNRTEIRLAHDDRMLYVMAKMYDGGERVVQSLIRDSDNAQWNSDSFTIVIDPINAKQNGVMFGVNAGGAQIDGSLGIESSQTLYSETWDERWFSAVKNYEEFWMVEFAIPFTSLRYNENNTEWGINFIRRDLMENFYYTWTPFPINFNGIDVNYMGSLVWQNVPKVKNNIMFIKPYAITNMNRNRGQDGFIDEETVDVGIDVKIPITRSLYSDISINPDFSNADVDQEVVNITRFDISLPERREFFLENNDIFTNFGFENLRPFFSRRIGLNNGNSIPILFGAKVTGNIGDDFRLGVMNVQTRKSNEIPSENNTVAAFSQRVFKRSAIKGMFINRNTTGDAPMDDYSQNFGRGVQLYFRKRELVQYH